MRRQHLHLGICSRQTRRLDVPRELVSRARDAWARTLARRVAVTTLPAEAGREREMQAAHRLENAEAETAHRDDFLHEGVPTA